MNVISTQRSFQKALIAPLAVGGLLLTAACGDDDDAEETDESPATQETTEDEDTATEEDEVEAEADADSADETSEGDAISMDEVEANNTAESCWAVMDDTVYDLTDWIDQHPGGEERIEQLCGTDATEAFEDQHGGQDGPEEQRSEFEIGSLDG